MDGKRRRGKLFTNIGFKEDPNILYPRIGNFCSRFLKDKMLDIVSANSDFGKNVIKEHKSFYERD